MKGTTKSGTKYRRVGNDRVNAGTYKAKDESGVYAHLGDYGAHISKYNEPTGPEYYAGAYVPGDPITSGLPAYDRSFNTPIGEFGIQAGNLVDAIGVSGSYMPNQQTQTYVNALLSLLGR